MWKKRRVRDRRAWALETLRTHREADGMCALCVMRFGTQSAWPCAPVRAAELYAGFSHVPEPDQPRPAAAGWWPARSLPSTETQLAAG